MSPKAAFHVGRYHYAASLEYGTVGFIKDQLNTGQIEVAVTVIDMGRPWGTKWSIGTVNTEDEADTLIAECQELIARFEANRL